MENPIKANLPYRESSIMQYNQLINIGQNWPVKFDVVLPTWDGWMGGWMDGWVDGWMYGWMDGWMDGWMETKK